MTTLTYDPKITAILLVDPYNDFLSEGGKLWSRAKPIAEEVGLLDNLRAIMRAAREAGLGIFFVPHRRWEPLQYKGWIPDPLSAPPSPVEYATARLLARAAGLVHRLFILRLFRGECSVSALPGWVLVRRREVLPDRLLLLAVSLFVFFDSGPPTRESADTTVPTAVPTFCATSVKTPPSTDVNLPFEASIPSEQVS